MSREDNTTYSMKVELPYEMLVPCRGLAAGTHSFGFELDKTFFRAWENEDILDASLHIGIEVGKGATALLDLKVSAKGEVTVACDRCLADLTLPVDYEGRLKVSFTHADEARAGDSDDTILLPDGERDVNLAQYVYDSVLLSLPMQRVHAPGGCDQEMIRFWQKNAGGMGRDNAGNPFEALKDMIS